MASGLPQPTVMIDTVQFTQARLVRPTADKHPQWEMLTHQRKSQGLTIRSVVLLEHRSKFISIAGKGLNSLCKVNVSSLPALLYGHNAIGLGSQDEIDLALEVSRLLLDQVTECWPQPPAWCEPERDFTRVDIAVQFPMSYRRLEAALSYAAQPGARSPTQIYRGESTILPMTGHRLAFYAKPQQLAKRKHLAPAMRNLRNLDVTRIELRLSGKRLQSTLNPAGIGVPRLHYDRLWPAIRNALASMYGRRASLQSVNSINELMAVLAVRNPEIFEARLQGLSRDRQRKMRLQVARSVSRIGFEDVGLSYLLQFDNPPPQARLEIPGIQPPFPDLIDRAKANLEMRKRSQN